jgi:flavin-binding protein dodecin
VKEMTSVYSLALKNALNEAQNACPEISHIFMFRKDGEIFVNDENTAQDTSDKTVEAFNNINKNAQTIDQIERLNIQGSEGEVDISLMDHTYLVTITSKNADKKHVNTVIRVLIPAFLRLIEGIPSPLKWGCLPKPTTFFIVPWR